jgi:hypothetical protein
MFFRVLSVMLDKSVSKIGIAALAKLEHLQQFLYRHDKFNHRDYRFFYMCLKQMPRLWISGMRIKIELETDLRLSGFASKAFQKAKKSLPTNQLALRELVLKRASKMPVGVALPDLKTLFLIRPKRDFKLGLSSVTELGLVELKQQLFEQILSSIGHQLVSLVVSVYDELYVDRVFQLCPKLQKFYITNMVVEFVGLNEPIGEHKYLVEFGFAENSLEPGSRFQPDFLLQIFRAVPNLRVWRVQNYLFDEPELKHISEALEQNLILQNLEQFHLISDVQFIDEHAADRSAHDELALSMEAANVMLRILIDHCPKLTTVGLKRGRDIFI